ncbi:ORF16 [Barthadenovirus mellis]|uniref:ORF16 n=1 Tax=Passerine adenovirus 1 TaxID=2779174 RepID=A0A7M4BEY5_9ADEN|nr:ORF16 [Passerine adenovirus 1]
MADQRKVFFWWLCIFRESCRFGCIGCTPRCRVCCA